VPPRLLAVLLTSAVLCGACASSEPPSAAPPPSAPAATDAPTTPPPAPTPVALAWQPCEDEFECAVLPVQLDADDPEAGSIELAVTRRPAPEPSQRIGSLVITPGGPGASAVDYLQAAWEQVPAPVRERFDLVAVDPRGVGRSTRVQCLSTAELDDYFAIDPDPDDAAELQTLQDSNRVLVEGCVRQSGAVLPYVSTPDAADDLDLLRASLGDDGLTYLGYSYGTAIGAAYLDRYPERVRAMVLDGGIDPTLRWDELLAGQSTGFDTALTAFLDDCERTRCAFRDAVDGDLFAAYDALAARIETERLPADGDRTLGPGEFSLGVGAGLYSRANGWPAIAQGLAQAQDGDGSTLLALSDSYLDRDDSGYSGVSEANLAVNCTDRPWPREVDPYLELADRVEAAAPRFGRAIALSGLGCAQWPVEAQRTPGPVTGEGAPPVVVIGTTRDPATPYAWSQALASQLSSGVLVTYDGDGHTVYRAGAPDCVRGPVDDYLLTGTAPPPLTC
jgi:pimeloyl-ACP methyl ester carboxylesterase